MGDRYTKYEKKASYKNMRTQCPFCHKWFERVSIQGHIENQHAFGENGPIKKVKRCPKCKEWISAKGYERHREQCNEI